MLINKLEIIAEIGVNHNGKLSYAKRLIDIAKKCKSTFVKFQMYNTDSHILKNAKMTQYQKKNLSSTTSQFLMAKKYELSFNEFNELNNYCKRKKIKFLASIFDLESLKNYVKLKIKFIKIPSGEITNFELLDEISKHKFKVYLSTGMSNLKEINQAIKLLKSKRKIKDVVIMQCTSDYPSKLSNSNLLTIPSLKNKFKCKIGYSDHTLGSDSSMIAVALGAEVIEKHITLNKNLKGPDHIASSSPREFLKFNAKIKQTIEMLGSKSKSLIKAEKKNIMYVRKSLVAKKCIKKNDFFSRNNLTTKRPGNGICASMFLKFLGKRSRFDFKKNEKIKI